MNNPMNLMQMFQSFRANPAQFLIQRKLNVPQDLMNDPNAIINHLLRTGQISQEAVNRAYQQMGQMQR